MNCKKRCEEKTEIQGSIVQYLDDQVLDSGTDMFRLTKVFEKPISLLSVGESVRSWPGGTGGHKLGLNYAPGFKPQKEATRRGYDQVLWLLRDGEEQKITEAGAMNFFIAVKREDGGEPLQSLRESH